MIYQAELVCATSNQSEILEYDPSQPYVSIKVLHSNFLVTTLHNYVMLGQVEIYSSDPVTKYHQAATLSQNITNHQPFVSFGPNFQEEAWR